MASVARRTSFAHTDARGPEWLSSLWALLWLACRWLSPLAVVFVKACEIIIGPDVEAARAEAGAPGADDEQVAA